MKVLEPLLIAFVLLALNHVTAQEIIKEVQSYKTESGIKIKTGMYFTILEGDHHKIKPSNFWDIQGGGKLSAPLNLFSYLREGNTYQIKKIIKVKGVQSTKKQILIGFKSDAKMIYVYVDDALSSKEIKIMERIDIDAIVKI